MKNYVGISRDHSGSMHHLTTAAKNDYNQTIKSVAQEAAKYDIDTIVSVVECGIGRPARVKRVVTNSNVQQLKPLTDYIANGNSTPLFDSVGDLIEQFEAVPDYDSVEVAFLVMVITDGEENSSDRWTGARLSNKIKELQKTDKWSFVFRVPRGGKRALTRMGIPEGNIFEWEQTQKGMETSTVATQSGMNDYYQARSTGARATSAFYTNIADLDINVVKADLVDISYELVVLAIDDSNASYPIREFVEHAGFNYVKGSAFYQLTKTELVQGNKTIIIKDTTTNKYYGGSAARALLGIDNTNVKLKPGYQGKYDVFVQSTSVNRKLIPGTTLIIWSNQHNL